MDTRILNDTLLRVERLLQSQDKPKAGINPGFSFKKSPERQEHSVVKEQKTTNTYLSTIVDHLKLISKKVVGEKSDEIKPTTQISPLLSNPKKLKQADKGSKIFLGLSKTARKGIENFQDDDKKSVSSGIENMMKFGTALESVSSGFIKGAKRFAMGTLLLAPAMLVLPIVAVGIMGISKLFSYMGEKRRRKRIDRGSRALGGIGKSLLFFSLGIAAFALTIVGITKGASLGSIGEGTSFLGIAKGLGAIGLGVLTIWGLSWVFERMGSRTSFKNILKGGVAVGVIGVALVGVAYALNHITQLEFVRETKWGTLAFLGATLAGTALIFRIAGSGASHILMGSAAFGAIGLSLVVFGWSLKKLYESDYFDEKPNWAKLGYLSATLGAVGLIFTGLGVAAGTGLPFMGAAAMVAIGGSLFVLGKGVDSMFGVVNKYGDNIAETGENFKALMANLGLGILAFVDPSVLQGAEEKSTWLGRFSSAVGSLVTGAVNTTTILAASAAMGASGLALRTMSKSFIKLQETKLLDKSPAEIDDLSYALTSVFSALGTAFNIPKEQRRNMLRGSFALSTTSIALGSVVRGLRSWQKLALPNKELYIRKNFLADETGTMEPNSLLEGIVATLRAIEKPFAIIGSHQTEGKSLLGKLMGSRNQVKDGIKAVRGTQGALTSVSQGLKAWAGENRIPGEELKIRKEFLEDETGKVVPNSILENIYATLRAIEKPFAAIGENQTSGKSLLGKLVGSRNAVKDGINSVKGTQKALSSVSKGLKAWYDTSIPSNEFNIRKEFFESDVGNLKPTSMLESIVSVLLAINQPFSIIGEDRPGLLGRMFGKKSDIQAGIGFVTETQEALKDISDNLLKFKVFSVSDFQTNYKKDKDGNLIFDGELSIMDNITLAISSIPRIFSEIGIANDASKPVKLFGFSMGKGTLDKGIKIAKVAAGTIKDLANGLLGFSKDIDYQAAAKNATNFISAYMGGMSEMSNGKSSKQGITFIKTSTEYLKENVKMLEQLEKVDKNAKSLNGLKSINTLFTDIGQLPHDKITEMFREMRELMIEMKDVNNEIVDKQIEMYKAQARKVEVELSKITGETPQPEQGEKKVENNNNTSHIAALATILEEVKRSIEELSDTMMDGSARFKLINMPENFEL